MSRRIALALVAAAAFSLEAAVAVADDRPFVSFTFTDRHQYTIDCAARYECDIQLDSGERVNDGFNANIDDWDPHIGYSGEKRLTPHLVLRPSRSGLRTNIILTTTKRTYYLLAVSSDRQQPSYYSFSFDDTYRELARRAVATQTALRASGARPVPTPTPADVADLSSTCFDYDYSYLVDRNVQSDHVPRARPSNETLPQSLVPKLVCSDGSHTFVEFPVGREVPADLPISLAVTSEGDTLINYTYLASLNRYTVDGVYDSFVLELGSQSAPLRLRIYHAGRGNPPAGRHDPRPIPITTPGASAASNASPGAASIRTANASPAPSGSPASSAPSAPSASPSPARMP